MEINPLAIKIKDLVEGFADNGEEGVTGYGGRLNIRPKYQREFVYDAKKQAAVISSVFRNFPLNVMYWAKNGDGTFELLDGQQRTLSICAYREGSFFIKIDGTPKGYGNLTEEQRDRFLGYRLQIYVCENGTDTEKAHWFETINIAGEKLTPQELDNALYPGPWVTEMKRIFSKSACAAYNLGSKYLTGSPIRQDYFRTVVEWICGDKSDDKIREYMAAHQHCPDADAEWQYFQEVIAWVQRTFPVYRREMRGVEWGALYNRHKGGSYPATALEKRVKALMMDDDVTSKKGIYPYLLSGEERHLSIRAFSAKMKTEAYHRQDGKCAVCGKRFEIGEMEADHIVPWCKGGPTTAANCQMLCRDDNRLKGGK